jgi:hypothetical protein
MHNRWIGWVVIDQGHFEGSLRVFATRPLEPLCTDRTIEEDDRLWIGSMLYQQHTEKKHEEEDGYGKLHECRPAIPAGFRIIAMVNSQHGRMRVLGQVIHTDPLTILQGVERLLSHTYTHKWRVAVVPPGRYSA